MYFIETNLYLNPACRIKPAQSGGAGIDRSLLIKPVRKDFVSANWLKY